MISKSIYPFKIGNFQCWTLYDGIFWLRKPAKIFFANAPQDQLAKALQEHGIAIAEWREYLSPFTCLLIQTDHHFILVDTGIGTGVTVGTGKLMDCLSMIGIAPEQIDIVLITHGHGDHIGGNTNAEGTPNFPNAKFIHPIHFIHPEWLTDFEKDGNQAVATRPQILKRAADEKTLVLSFPFPGLGHINQADSGWEWQPLD
jgi:hypothetical protein